jgi:cytochrome c
MKKALFTVTCAALLATGGLMMTPAAGLSGVAWAAEDGAGQAQALLDKAVAKINADGPKAAFAAFDDPKGGFVMGEHYVFVFDLHGVYQASGANPKLVGTNAIDLKDAEGKALVREMVALAERHGKGTVDYVWLNRATNRVERKHSQIQKVGDYVVGVGFYEH